jgi:hypothetical protein
MQQTTPQPGHPGGPGSVRRPPEAAPPVIRARQESAPVMRARRPSSLLRALEGLQSYVLSEETLILVEFVIVVAIGLFVFVQVLHPMEGLMQALGRAIANLGLSKLLK